jgi:hypothetical protein
MLEDYKADTQKLNGSSPLAIVVRVVTVRQRIRGCVSPTHICISANATWLRGMIAVADYSGASKPEW